MLFEQPIRQDAMPCAIPAPYHFRIEFPLLRV